MVASTETIAQFLAEALQAPLSFDVESDVRDELKKLKGLPLIENGCVYGEDWDLYDSYKKGDAEFTPPAPMKEKFSRLEGDFLHVFHPVYSNDRSSVIGALYLRASTAILEQKINRYLVTMGIGLICLVFITYLLAARFQRIISGPILKLAKVTEHITRDADYSVRVRKEGDDEIGVLYTGFNNMLEQIQLREKQRDQAEAEQKRLLVELEEKNKELEQVVYVTSHDLRSPLVNIQGFSKELGYSLDELNELLGGDNIPGEVKEKFAMILEEDIQDSLKYILSSTTKMDSLLSGLLKLSRVGRTATTFGDVDMNELITEVSNAFEFQVKEGGVELNVDELPPCYGNDVQLNQLFSNLLNNGLKYLDPERAGKISISGREDDEENVYWVSDNGVGICQEHQKKVFEIFHRLNPTETQGEGLGLTIVNKIVSRHSGRIWVESEPGKGSTFYVTLQKPKELDEPVKKA